MEIILALIVLGAVGWWFFLRTPKTQEEKNTQEANAPYKTEAPVVAPVEQSAVKETEAVAPSWHVAPAKGSPLADNVLDVNHDGKVDMDDIKEIVTKKPRKPRTPKVAVPAEKPSKKPAASKKPAVIKAPAKAPAKRGPKKTK